METLKDTTIPLHKDLTLNLFNKRNTTKQIRKFCSELYPELIIKKETITVSYNTIEHTNISNWLKNIDTDEANNIITDLIMKYITTTRVI